MLFIVANMPIVHLVSRCLCILAAATYRCMKFSYLQPRIRLTISERNRMMILGLSVHSKYNSKWWKTCSNSSKRRLQRSSLGQRWYLQVIQHYLIGHYNDYQHSVVPVADVAWLFGHFHNVKSPVEGSLVNRMHTSSHPATNQSLWRWYALARQFKDLHCGCVFFWHFGGGIDGW